MPLISLESAAPELTFSLLARMAVVRRHPFTTGWRTLPFAVVEQLTEGCYRIDIDRGETHTVGPGEAFVIPASVRHRLSVTSRGRARATPRASVRWAHVQWTAFGYLDPLSKVGGVLLFDRRNGGRVGEAIDLFVATPVSEQPSAAAVRAAARVQEAGFRLLGMLLDRAGEEWVETGNEEMRRIRPALELIHANLGTKLTRASLAESVFLSPTRFHYVFARVTGQAPMAYVRRVRIERALRMLIHSDLAVSDIARRVGFDDQYYFSRTFRRQTGEAPSAYRRRIRYSTTG